MICVPLKTLRKKQNKMFPVFDSTSNKPCFSIMDGIAPCWSCVAEVHAGKVLDGSWGCCSGTSQFWGVGGALEFDFFGKITTM
jgi:hypothetical protein